MPKYYNKQSHSAEKRRIIERSKGLKKIKTGRVRVMVDTDTGTVLRSEIEYKYGRA